MTTTRRARRRPLLAAVAALSLLGAACSKDAKPPTSADRAKASPEKAAGTQAEPVSTEPSVAAMALAPVPEAAKGPPIVPQKGYRVEKVRDNLYIVTDGIYQSMFLTTGKGVVLVDAPPQLARILPPAIAEVTREPITHLVYSHAHTDHIGAARAVAPHAIVVGQAETARLVARMKDDRVPVPTMTFTDHLTLRVGSETLELSYFGANHNEGNTFIYAPRQKTLMLVDVIWPGWAPFQGLGEAVDVPGFIEAHDRALSFDFDVFVGGHLNRVGTRQDVETSKEYLTDLRTNAAAALRSVDFQAVYKEVGTRLGGFDNVWALTQAYFERVATACTEPTLAKWKDRLAGADVFTESNCAAMSQSLRGDNNLLS